MMPGLGEDAPVVEIHDADGLLGTIASIDGHLIGSSRVIQKLADRLAAAHGDGAWDYLLSLDNGYVRAQPVT